MAESFFSTTTDWRDAKWNRDYAAALKDLTARPRRKLLPVFEAAFEEVPRFTPREVGQFSVPLEEHTFDPECREDVLALVKIQKTVKPGLRAVFYDGVLVGKVGKNPYGLGWVASCSRGLLYWSVQDAALALIDGAGVLP
jgi:hypothetical protein